MAYSLLFQGYYRDEIRRLFPSSAGIYCVYRGVYNPQSRCITLMELLYIGETNNLHQRHNEHDRRTDFLEQLEHGEILVYTYAPFNGGENDRRRLEAALVYEMQPPLNEKLVNGFNYPPTEIILSGEKHAYLPNRICSPSF